MSLHMPLSQTPGQLHAVQVYHRTLGANAAEMDFRNLDGRVGAGLRQEYFMAARFQQHVNEFQEISIVST